VPPPPEMANLARRGPIERMSRFGLEAALPLSQLVLSGVFDRFPTLKIFFAETRLGWVPFWLEQCDLQYFRTLEWAEEILGVQPLERLPSEYIKEHIHWSVQYERVAVELRHHIGVDHIMFATDFPHIECEWPNSQTFLKELYADVSDDERERIWHGNVVDFFGLS
ncbi:MAG: amidohydrolase family protein, partial [Dehalococcoidia bacterium]